jgi:hypothetical protein
MAFPSTPIVPDTLNFTANFSTQLDAYNKVQIKVVPKNPDGTPFNCTSATTVDVYGSNYAQGPAGSNGVDATGTITAHDATGLTFTLDSANLNTLTLAANPAMKLSVIMSDGTTPLVAASGQARLVVNP